jgi:hypothetical protein
MAQCKALCWALTLGNRTVCVCYNNLPTIAALHCCRNNPKCKSFTFECGSGYCGYLKSVAMDKAQYREDYCVGVVVP